MHKDLLASLLLLLSLLGFFFKIFLYCPLSGHGGMRVLGIGIPSAGKTL